MARLALALAVMASPASLGISSGQTLVTAGVEGQAVDLLAVTTSTIRAWA